MVNERYAIAMAETLHYLKGIKQDDINKIPNQFMTFLKNNASQEYKCEFDYTKPLEELDLRNETRGFISMICLNYWCETEEQKNSFTKHLSENEARYQEELKKKYNIDGIFKEKKPISKSETRLENIVTDKLFPQKENMLKRVWNRIKKFLHIKEDR